jgi:hypothetical protein
MTDTDYAAKLAKLRELAAELLRECDSSFWRKASPPVFILVGDDGVPLLDEDGYAIATATDDHDTGGEGEWRLYVPAEDWTSSEERSV